MDIPTFFITSITTDKVERPNISILRNFILANSSICHSVTKSPSLDLRNGITSYNGCDDIITPPPAMVWFRRLPISVSIVVIKSCASVGSNEDINPLTSLLLFIKSVNVVKSLFSEICPLIVFAILLESLKSMPLSFAKSRNKVLTE